MLRGAELQALRDRLRNAEGDVLNANKALQRKDAEILAQRDTVLQLRAHEARADALEGQLAKEKARARELVRVIWWLLCDSRSVYSVTASASPAPSTAAFCRLPARPCLLPS